MTTARFALRALGFAFLFTLGVPAIGSGQSCVAPPSGLLAWWPGNGDAADIVGGAGLTAQGGASFGAGLVGQAFQLDGADDAFESGSAAFNPGTGDFSVDFWVRFNSTSGEQVLIEKWEDGVSGWTLTKLGGNQIQFAAIGSGYPTSSVLTIPNNTWIHFAARRSGNTIAAFMNGSQILSDTTSANLDSASPLLLGRRSDGRGFFLNGRIDEVHFFSGHALSNSEIQAIHAAGNAGVCVVAVCGNGTTQDPEECDDGNMVDGDGCESDCTLSCGNGVTTGAEVCDDGNRDDDDGCDSNCTPTGCGNGIPTSGEDCDDGNAVETDACLNDCSLNVCGDNLLNTGVEECDDGNLAGGDGCDPDCTIGHVCIPPPADILGWWPGEGSVGDLAGGFNAELENGADYAAGKIGQAFALDGVDDFVAVPSRPMLNFSTGDFTVDLWVRFDATSGEQVLVEKYVEKFHPEASAGWTLTKLSSNALRFVTKTEGVDSARLSLQPLVWYHFAARRSGTQLSIFLNGSKVGDATADATPDVSSSSSLKFGHRGGPADTPGSTDTRGFFVRGRIDDVHVFARALSDAEILSIYGADDAGQCVATPACGNGLTEAGEACDDGNGSSDDGCENDCTLSCGNGTPVAPEACDDGNLTEGDGCDSNCTASACGNGIADPTEGCDDGNLTDGDGCDSNCTATACGNGIRTASSGEDCDDGNLVDGDGCQSDCTMTAVVENVGPGGMVNTDPEGHGATPGAPIQVALTTPGGGTVTIATSTEPLSPQGVFQLVQQLLIEAPPASFDAPLSIVLTVDASAIPPGVDLLRVDITRDGKLLEMCSGPSGHAVPDPCIQERVELMDGDVRITSLTSHASLWSAVVRGLFKTEQKCVNGIAKAGTKVAAAQAGLNGACLDGANRGKVADAQTCTTTDARGKVAKAKQKTTALADKLCDPAPPFGFLSPMDVNDAAELAELALTADLFGDNLNGAVSSDKDAARCQATVRKGVDRVFAAKAKLLFDCVKSGLADKTATMVTTEDLARCLDSVDADVDSKAAKAGGKLAGALIDACDGVTLLTAFPGDCSSSDDVSYCFETAVDCRLCQMFDAMTGLATDCDAFDDGTVNASCD